MPATTTESPALAVPRVALLGVVFCLSGASALVYQVAWQRILALQSGAGIYSIAVIVAAFMAGLGLGSHVGGRLSARLGPGTALAVFAALELGIGLFALASVPLYYDLLYLEGFQLYQSPWAAALLHFAALALPTTMMGMSLPMLVHATVADAPSAYRTIGYLYGINVVGAALGAVLAPWVLMRQFGVSGAIVAGAGGNLVAGLAALTVGRARGRPAPPAAEGEPPAPEAVAGEPERATLALWIALYAVSGFCALALEILWFRLIDVAVKSTAFTFGSVLFVYLVGFAAGIFAGVRWAGRIRRPLRAFLLCQSLLLLYSGAAVLLLARAPTHWPLYSDYVAYWSLPDEFQLGAEWNPLRVLKLYLVLPGFLYALPTALMGLAFTVLQRAVHDARSTVGRKVGLLQAMNILGNVAGSLLIGLVAIDRLGTAASLELVLVLGLLFPLLGLARRAGRASFATLAGLSLVVLALLPGSERLWTRLHGAPAEAGPALVAEDASGVVVIMPETMSETEDWRLSINGKQHSWFPYSGIHSELGAVGVLVHPRPVEVAIIGLGSGDTAWAASARPETERVTVFELSSVQWPLLERASALGGLPGLRSLVADPRVRVVTADGRNALARSDVQYDVIESDALRPGSAFAGNLYSRRFFETCAGKLAPGGIMVQWNPTPRTYTTFATVFPYVLEVSYRSILLGSHDPLPNDPALWEQRLHSAPVRDWLGPLVTQQIAAALPTARVSPGAPPPGVPLNEDLFPRDEFHVPFGP